VQVAAPTLLDVRRTMQPILHCRLRQNLAELDVQLSQNKSCCRLELEGGWYAAVRVPATQSDEDLAIALIHGMSVLVHPGHLYDFPTDGYLILSLITAPDVFTQGVRRIVQTV